MNHLHRRSFKKNLVSNMILFLETCKHVYYLFKVKSTHKIYRCKGEKKERKIEDL